MVYQVSFLIRRRRALFFFFFFNDTATTEIYTLSLHDALPISHLARVERHQWDDHQQPHHVHEIRDDQHRQMGDRKSTRLNSSHSQISYAVFCLKKKKKHNTGVSRRKCHRQSPTASVPTIDVRV